MDINITGNYRIISVGEISALERRIQDLLGWGWKRVLVVTDHGWLLLPGGLPKADLPEHLTLIRKGRCARLKKMSNTDQDTMPWYWDNDVVLPSPRYLLL